MPSLFSADTPSRLETYAERGERFGVITDVARQLGVGLESLRNWVKQAEIDGDLRPGTRGLWRAPRP